MPDLTPPPMSEEDIRDVLRKAACDLHPDLPPDDLVFDEPAFRNLKWVLDAFRAARDEQWRQRLEIVGWHYRTNGTWDHFHAGTEPPPEDAYDAGSLVTLYRIKEQG